MTKGRNAVSFIFIWKHGTLYKMEQFFQTRKWNSLYLQHSTSRMGLAQVMICCANKNALGPFQTILLSPPNQSTSEFLCVLKLVATFYCIKRVLGLSFASKFSWMWSLLGQSIFAQSLKKNRREKGSTRDRSLVAANIGSGIVIV